jgi:LytS/YehU family sensor histidine kinase
VSARIEPAASGLELHIAVTNTGAAPDADRGVEPSAESNGVGLHLVERRLRACYGEAASVSLRRDEAAGVTIAELRLPAAGVRAEHPSPQPSPRKRGEGVDVERLVS